MGNNGDRIESKTDAKWKANSCKGNKRGIYK